MTKGNTFFKNTAILMAIFPIYNLIMGLINGVGTLSGFINIEDFASSTGFIHTAIIFFIIGAIVQIIVGIIGMKNADSPDKMNSCILLGVVVMLIYAASQILDYLGGGVHDTLDYIGMIAGFAIPAGFIIGAVQTKASD